jgi:hypothetical protein
MSVLFTEVRTSIGFSVLVSQVLVPGNTIYPVAITITAGSAFGYITNAITIAGTNGYQGQAWDAAQSATSGNSGGVVIGSYASVGDYLRNGAISDNLYGTNIRLNRVYIDNPNNRLAFEFRNIGVVNSTLACRIHGTVTP